jgi:uncharacterized protein involved in exopolysaccharide biosynthesis
MRNVRQEIPVSADVPIALAHLRDRWRLIAISCGVAALAALAMSLLMTRQYTSTCRIVIDPPAGSDARVSTAVSPIYLESLRTYELFASSDDLFLQAARKFGLRQDSTPIEKLKKRILKVEVLRNTKILQIEATLPDPAKAHELSLYLGQAAVDLNRRVAQTADSELRVDAEKQATEARQALENAQRAWGDVSVKDPVEQLTGELAADIELRTSLQREYAVAQADLAEDEASATAQARPGAVSASRARAEQLRAQLKQLDDTIAREQAQVAERSVRLNKLDAEREAAEAAMKAAETRLNDVRAAAGFRGERLSIIDPGIVPERPSSPNVALNVLVAAFAALILALVYILIQIGYRSHAGYD